MTYTPTNWQTGDVITAEKLNKIENGIAGTSGLKILPIVDSKVTCAEADVTAGTLFVFGGGDGQFTVNIVTEKSHDDRLGKTLLTSMTASGESVVATMWNYDTSLGAYIVNESGEDS